MAGKIRVAVLAGGRSSEHDVSLASARSVLEFLDPEEYDVVTVAIGRDGRWELGSGSGDSVAETLPVPDLAAYAQFALRADGKEMSTTMAAVRLLSALLKRLLYEFLFGYKQLHDFSGAQPIEIYRIHIRLFGGCQMLGCCCFFLRHRNA